MRFHTKGLSSGQKEILRSVGPFAAQNHFYLGGGTDLAIYLGHHRSVGLDWFTGEHFPDPMAFAQTLRNLKIPVITEQTSPGTLHGQICGVRVSFLEFRYPLLSSLNTWPEIDVPLASLDDLACMKLSAVTQRGSKKDFYDVYFLCKCHRPLPELLKLYQQKFSVTDIGPVLYSLVYFDDADQEPDPLLFEKVSWEQVKEAFRSWAKEI